ncbi:hypothetical protein U1Q18_022264, partial [Sarracenia purpurea var. burkii]
SQSCELNQMDLSLGQASHFDCRGLAFEECMVMSSNSSFTLLSNYAYWSSSSWLLRASVQIRAPSY